MIFAMMAAGFYLAEGTATPDIGLAGIIAATFAGITGLVVAVGGLIIGLRTSRVTKEVSGKVDAVHEQGNGRLHALAEANALKDARIEQLMVELGRLGVVIPPSPVVVPISTPVIPVTYPPASYGTAIKPGS